MVTDVMQNQIGCAIDYSIVRHQDFGRAQNEGPSPVSKRWLIAEHLSRATETQIAFMKSACPKPRLFRDSYKSLQNQLGNFPFWVGVSKPQIAYRFEGAGTGQIAFVRHGCQMIVQEACSVTRCPKNQVPIPSDNWKLEN